MTRVCSTTGLGATDAVSTLALLATLGVIATVVTSRTETFAGTVQAQASRQAQYHVDINSPNCDDSPGHGSQSSPYCSLRYVSTIAEPGDTFLIKSGRYGNGPVAFTRSGTATAPITYKAVGDVVIGSFDDLADERFQATEIANVYALDYDFKRPGGHKLLQTFFDPILVDDPNATIFTMRDDDGPLIVSNVTDRDTLARIEGTWFVDGAVGKLYVHPYGNRQPSSSRTDFVMAHRVYGSLAIDRKTKYNVFDGFRLSYLANYSFQVLGSSNRVLNLKFQAVGFRIMGTSNYAENITVTHNITRGETWEWHYSGQGGGIGVGGVNNRLRNLHLYHNWNSTVDTDVASSAVIDGLRTHGAPNHCGSVGGEWAKGGGGNVVRNVVKYNCQDYFYLNETDHVVIEHATVPGGIFLQAIRQPIRGVTVRNSILGGSWSWNQGVSKAITCDWEAASLFENNIISSKATIKHCEDAVTYAISDYVDKCQRGVLTHCMTVRGNILVSDFKAVIKDGMWHAGLGDTWDVTLVPGSPAIDRGIGSGVASDIAGVARPQGRASDIGAYEYCPRGCATSPIALTAPLNFRDASK
jgi:hypothetical protein